MNIDKIKHNPHLIDIADTDTSHTGDYLDKLSSLFDGDLNHHNTYNYGVLVREDNFNFEFTIKSNANILYYCDTYYSDGAGNTDGSKLYFKNLNPETNQFEGKYNLQDFKVGKWCYMGKFKKGTYKCFADKPYVKFTEWKVYTDITECIESNNKYFQLKEENFIKDGTVPLTKLDNSLFDTDLELSDLFKEDEKIQKILNTSNTDKFKVLIKRAKGD